MPLNINKKFTLVKYLGDNITLSNLTTKNQISKIFRVNNAGTSFTAWNSAVTNDTFQGFTSLAPFTGYYFVAKDDFPNFQIYSQADRANTSSPITQKFSISDYICEPLSADNNDQKGRLDKIFAVTSDGRAFTSWDSRSVFNGFNTIEKNKTYIFIAKDSPAGGFPINLCSDPLGNCYQSSTLCGTNPFPMRNVSKGFCNSVGGFFEAGSINTTRCPNLPQEDPTNPENIFGDLRIFGISSIIDRSTSSRATTHLTVNHTNPNIFPTSSLQSDSTLRILTIPQGANSVNGDGITLYGQPGTKLYYNALANFEGSPDNLLIYRNVINNEPQNQIAMVTWNSPYLGKPFILVTPQNEILEQLFGTGSWVPDIFPKFELEYSTNGTSWNPVLWPIPFSTKNHYLNNNIKLTYFPTSLFPNTLKNVYAMFRIKYNLGLGAGNKFSNIGMYKIDDSVGRDLQTVCRKENGSALLITDNPCYYCSESWYIGPYSDADSNTVVPPGAS